MPEGIIRNQKEISSKKYVNLVLIEYETIYFYLT